jgi:uncharacterized protein DUF1707
MSLDPSMRASDGDRDAVAEQLQRAHAEGRLTLEELQERLDAAYRARTLGELAPLTRDLPAAVPPGRRAAPPATPAGQLERRGVRAAWGAWATATLVCTVIWLASSLSGGFGSFWPIWVAGPWGAVLLARTLFGHPPERPGRRDGERDHP